MECVECGRSLAPGTRAFAGRVKAESMGITRFLCSDCAEAPKAERGWEPLKSEEGLAAVSKMLRPPH
jgi:hypothetical protein